jgi:hypothetical protein
MKLKTRKRTKAEQPQLTPPAGTPEAEVNDGANVLVSYGIHRGRFPIGGMSVGQAREILQRLIRVDPTAVAVINGSRVGEDELISEDVTMLSFVKPSSLRG